MATEERACAEAQEQQRGIARGVIMAVATPAGSPRGTIPARQSSPADPAIGHLAGRARSLARDGADLLTVPAGIAHPRRRRGIRHRCRFQICHLAIAILRLAGAGSIAAALRYPRAAGPAGHYGRSRSTNRLAEALEGNLPDMNTLA